MAIVALLVMFAITLVSGQSVSRTASAQPASTAVLDWNAHASSVFLNPPTAATPGLGQPPQVAVLHMAMVQGAVYDAVNSIVGGYQPYLDVPAADPSASLTAAVATAAHDVIVGVVIEPAMTPDMIARIDLAWGDSITAATAADGQEAVEAGIAAGEAAAAAMLAARAEDGRYVPYTFPTGTEVGQWRPTPPSNSSDPNAWVAHVEPFVAESTSQFRPKGPRPLNSVLYAVEYYETMMFGSVNSRWRTAEMDAQATFFTAHPVELFNRAFRTVAAEHGLTTIEQARLFAMLNMAGADALINTWNDKATRFTWRPITAIHEGNNDGNRMTVGDPNWEPKVPTPNYPENTSGYNAITAAFMHTAEAIFGSDETSFSLIRTMPDGQVVTRHYTRYTDVIKDTIGGRIYQGIHFRTAEVQGAKLGQDASRFLVETSFRPVE
jgi:hypothetical protein